MTGESTVAGGAQVLGMAHMVLRVRDWRTSSRWYQDVLGCQRLKAEGFSVFRPPGAGFGILLLPTDGELPASSVPSQRIDHLALHVADIDALRAWQATLAEKGIPVEIDEVPSIGSSITLHDPDGLEIELFTPAPGSILAGA